MATNGLLNHEELVDLYVNAWNALTADLLAPALDDNFRYGSMWVLTDLVGKHAYMDYIRGKIEAIRSSHSEVKAQKVILHRLVWLVSNFFRMDIEVPKLMLSLIME